MHAAGLTNQVQDGCGNVVNGGVVALTGVDEVARQFGGVLPVLEGDTRPDGGVPGKDVRIIVEAVRKVARKLLFTNLCGSIREAQRALLSYRLNCRLACRFAGRVLYRIISEGALRPRRDLLIQLIIRILSIPILLVLSH